MKNQELMNALQSIGQKVATAKNELLPMLKDVKGEKHSTRTVWERREVALQAVNEVEAELNAICQRLALEQGIYVPPTGGSDVKPGRGLGINLSINIDKLFGE